VDYGSKAECPAYWPFLTTQQERVVEELGISHLLWAPTAEDSHRWVEDKCARMAAELDERRHIATRTPETALQELVPIAKVLREVAELAPSGTEDPLRRVVQRCPPR
jgi:hypothetical protein